MKHHISVLKRTEREHSFTTGVLWKQMLLYMTPIMLGSLMQQLYNTVDTIIVGRYLGVAALAAVGGSTSTVTTLLVNFFAGLSAGAAAVVAQDFGAEDLLRREKSVSAALTLGLLSGLLFLVMGELLAGWVLRCMAVPEAVFGPAIWYLRIYMLGMIPFALYNMGSAILNAVGDSGSSFRYLAISCVVNILLDLLFVAGLGFGIGGAAAATCLAQALSTLLILGSLLKRGILKRFRLAIAEGAMGRILRIGVPGGLQSGLYSIANMVVQWAINQYSISNVAAVGVYERIEGIFWTLMIALGVAVTTFTGQNYGAGKLERMKNSVRVAMIFGCGFAVIISVFFMVFASPVCGLFTSDPDTLDNTRRILYLLMPFCIIYVPTEVFGGAIKGKGDGMTPMFLTLICTCGLRILWILGGVVFHVNNILVCLACFPMSWGISSLAFTICYFRRKAEKQNVLSAVNNDSR